MVVTVGRKARSRGRMQRRRPRLWAAAAAVEGDDGGVGYHHSAWFGFNKDRPWLRLYTHFGKVFELIDGRFAIDRPHSEMLGRAKP